MSIEEAIAAINPSQTSSLAELFGALQKLDAAQNEGLFSTEEVRQLESDLKLKFSGWMRLQVDAIDPNNSDSLKDFLNLQCVQRTDEYTRLIDPSTNIHNYAEDQIEEKFNQLIRNMGKAINPDDVNAVNNFFDLQLIQATDIYDELAASVTHRYVEGQMADKFNEWVLKRIDAINTEDSSALEDFFYIEVIEKTEEYNGLASAGTIIYESAQMGNKFNNWLRNMADQLDPDNSGFFEDLEQLRLAQQTDTYMNFATYETDDYLEEQLPIKFGEYVTDMANGLSSSSSSRIEDLYQLVTLQQTDIYAELCPNSAINHVKDRLSTVFGKTPGQTPSIVGTLPRNGDLDVPVSHSILLIFDQAMAPTLVEDAISISPPLDWEISWCAANWEIATWGKGDGYIVALLKPLGPLAYNTSYTITVAPDATSVEADKMNSQYSFGFATKGSVNPPTVISTSPSDWQPNASPSGPIEITFNQEMKPESVESAIKVIPSFDYGIRWKEGNTIAVLQPFEPLAFDTGFTVKIGSKVLSSNWESLGDNYILSFFTGIHGIPEFSSTMPEDGQTDIPSNYPIQIVFDRSMDPSSVEAALTVTPAIEYTTNWAEAGFVLNIEPSAQLKKQTTYTFEIGYGATSSFGCPLNNPIQLSFSTSGN